jgi:hypothetical protein
MKLRKVICVIAAVLFAGVLNGYAQGGWFRLSKVNDYGFPFDSTYVWHPERVYVVWPDMRLEFRLPTEQSGVANMLFRDRKSGEVRLLDSVEDNPNYGKPYESLNDVKRVRQAIRFEPGSYDAILLYNDGKYIVYDNLVIEPGVVSVVDMSAERVCRANSDSRKWLKLRKFTDVVGGKRLIERKSPETSPYKIAGYVFDPERMPNHFADFYSVDLSPDGTLSESVAGISADGYFELDVREDNVIRPLNLHYSPMSDFNLDVESDTWLFIVTKEPPSRAERLSKGDVEAPKIIGEGAVLQKQ